MTTPRDLIVDQDAFARLCRDCLDLEAVALDTEFERTRTYYPRPALIQLCDGERTHLIDPLAFDDFSPLAALLARASLTKVMHACEGDNEVFELLTGAIPGPVFDTQVAAAFAGHGYSTSYRELLRTLLGVGLAKAETRSDWLARPLSPAQLEYAVLDVAYLPELHARLRSRLESLGRMPWLREEMERLQAQRLADRAPDRAYRKIRSARGLPPRTRALLRSLAAWREGEARRRDLPRRMVLGDDALMGLAVEAPGDHEALGRVRALSQRAARRYGEALIEAVSRVLESVRPVPSAEPDQGVTPDSRVLTRLKEVVRNRAEELDLPPALLAHGRALEALAARHAAGDRSLPEELSGWRAAAIGLELLAALGA